MVIESRLNKFCSCIKKVKQSRKNKKELPAIAICVKSVLQTKGKTLKQFRCGGKSPYLQIQSMKK